MKNSTKKSFDQKLQDKRHFLKKITTTSTLGSYYSNFKKAGFFRGGIRRRLLYLFSYFELCLEPSLILFVIQNKQRTSGHDLLGHSVLELESSFTVKF